AQPLMWLEAMKMEHRITAPAAGTVTDLPVSPGQRVDAGAALAVVDADGSAADGSEEDRSGDAPAARRPDAHDSRAGGAVDLSSG
ncbi:acetyl-CoA carboxylase biotin carboxyl carrier protein subunit, partial [Nocardiopsis gilva]|uniref:acetyl-CoA carboxylase biotin carboxyl carrier protein subunit n=1 Tax=Nocardiopsis gilva TaxID=280236 RepID=UPI000476F8BE